MEAGRPYGTVPPISLSAPNRPSSPFTDEYDLRALAVTATALIDSIDAQHFQQTIQNIQDIQLTALALAANHGLPRPRGTAEEAVTVQSPLARLMVPTPDSGYGTAHPSAVPSRHSSPILGRTISSVERIADIAILTGAERSPTPDIEREIVATYHLSILAKREGIPLERVLANTGTEFVGPSSHCDLPCMLGCGKSCVFEGVRTFEALRPGRRAGGRDLYTRMIEEERLVGWRRRRGKGFWKRGRNFLGDLLMRGGELLSL
jgi:hypothetical protein